MIKVIEIKKRFGDQEVHKGITFTAREHETLVILGRSGGGKSVLLKMIIGLLKPDSGTIEIDGKDISKLTYTELQKVRFRFGFLFQNAALFDSMTVGENVALALERHSNYKKMEITDRVEYALETVGLKNSSHKMPSQISGGMRKRVGLARAIVLTPKYMLYDEPTTGLDMETADGINSLINELKNTLGMTSIAVTHDIHSAFLIGDRFTIFSNGTVRMTGTKDEILNSNDDEVKKYIESEFVNKR